MELVSDLFSELVGRVLHLVVCPIVAPLVSGHDGWASAGGVHAQFSFMGDTLVASSIWDFRAVDMGVC